ncbi:MAG: trypsin-like serine protease, partial [Gammaproteobacteria bacterium]|nr:trypsin-like serine protease [Gammaproteobacteria bacterium]
MSKTSKQIALFILLGVTTGLILGWTSNSKVQLWIQELTSPLNKGRADVALGYADTVEKVLPAVVRIYRISFDTSANPALLDDPHYQQFITGELVAEQGTVYGLGSGVIISTRGHILTNHHVIAGADQLEVKLNDNRSAIAQIIGVDPETDLALLKIDLPDLQPALIPQQDKSRPGDIVLAIGNPHGLGTSVSMGIISALGRNQLGLNTFENFIQTDAPINSGNSGGPLINTSGQLIGINTAHFYNTGTSTRSQGLGLAIPISTASQVANSLLKDGKVIRGWLGITIDLISQQMSGSLLQH